MTMPDQAAPALPAAAAWLAGMMTGSATTIVAVIAVAMLGLLMLAGRMPVRRGVTVVLGCFVLFSAGEIAAALTSAAPPVAAVNQPVPPAPPPTYRPKAPAPVPYDPYAGASVPQQAPSQAPLR